MAEDLKTAEYASRWEANPQSIVFARLADLHRISGEINKAIEVCEKGLESNPNYVTGHLILGRCYLERGITDKAQECFEKTLSIDRRNLLAMRMLGDILISQGRRKEGVQKYAQILAIDPLDESIQELYQRYQGFELFGDPVQALGLQAKVEAAMRQAGPAVEEVAAPAQPATADLESAPPAEEKTVAEAAPAEAEPGLDAIEDQVDQLTSETEPKTSTEIQQPVTPVARGAALTERGEEELVVDDAIESSPAFEEYVADVEAATRPSGPQTTLDASAKDVEELFIESSAKEPQPKRSEPAVPKETEAEPSVQAPEPQPPQVPTEQPAPVETEPVDKTTPLEPEAEQDTLEPSPQEQPGETAIEATQETTLEATDKSDADLETALADQATGFATEEPAIDQSMGDAQEAEKEQQSEHETTPEILDVADDTTEQPSPIETESMDEEIPSGPERVLEATQADQPQEAQVQEPVQEETTSSDVEAALESAGESIETAGPGQPQPQEQEGPAPVQDMLQSTAMDDLVMDDSLTKEVPTAEEQAQEEDAGSDFYNVTGESAQAEAVDQAELTGMEQVEMKESLAEDVEEQDQAESEEESVSDSGVAETEMEQAPTQEAKVDSGEPNTFDEATIVTESSPTEQIESVEAKAAEATEKLSESDTALEKPEELAAVNEQEIAELEESVLESDLVMKDTLEDQVEEPTAQPEQETTGEFYNVAGGSAESETVDESELQGMDQVEMQEDLDQEPETEQPAATVQKAEPVQKEIPSPDTKKVEELVQQHPLQKSSIEIPEGVASPTLAELFYRQGQMDQALEVYRFLLARSPNDAKIKHRIKEIKSLGPMEPNSRAARAATDDTTKSSKKLKTKKKRGRPPKKTKKGDSRPLAGIRIKSKKKT